MPTADVAIDTILLPNLSDSESEVANGTTYVFGDDVTIPLAKEPQYHYHNISVPIIFHSMGDDTPILFKARADVYPVNFLSAGPRRYNYINVFDDTIDIPTAPKDVEEVT